jgi:hypothetical protein
MTPTDPLLSSITAAAACSFLLDQAQKSKIVPWITAHTKWINLGVKIALSGASTLGISHAWTPAATGGGQFLVTVPATTVILMGLWHWFGQFALQHGFGQLLTVGTLTTVDVPVQVHEVEPKPTP